MAIVEMAKLRFVQVEELSVRNASPQKLNWEFPQIKGYLILGSF